MTGSETGTGATPGDPRRGAVPRRARRLPPAGRRARRLALLLLLCLPRLAAGQTLASASPSEVEAAFLRNFAHYLTWPAQAFADDRAPWRVCILGDDPYGEILERTFRGRTEQGRSFEVHRADTLAGLPQCQIVVVLSKVGERRRTALAELRSRPVLTVGEAPEFLQEGGIIRFQVSDHVTFGVNLDQARAASLRIPAKMLEVAHEVLENGVVRRRG